MQKAQGPRKGTARTKGAESEVPRMEILKQQQQRGRKDSKARKRERERASWQWAQVQGASSGSNLMGHIRWALASPSSVTPVPTPRTTKLSGPGGGEFWWAARVPPPPQVSCPARLWEPRLLSPALGGLQGRDC